MPKKNFDPKTHVDLGRLCEVFDRVKISEPLRMQTLHDVVRVIDGEIKPATVYRNLTRRLGEQSSPAL